VLPSGVPVWEAFSVTGSGGSDTLYRLREGIERFLITDINNTAASAAAQSEVPVMWDQTQATRRDYANEEFNHIPGGANCLYMDGHLEFIRYPAAEIPCDPLMVTMGVGW
jgi:prepilin-type processing-associated H-X9-DG protein